LNFFATLSYPRNSTLKMVKDVNAPKRPLTGYIRYINTIRAEVERETGLNGIKVTPHLSARWNALSEEEKDSFNQAFAKEMVKHKAVMAKYKKTDAYEAFQQKKKAKNSKRPKDKNAPKRATSSFMIFANDIRDEVKENNPEASFGEVGRIMGQQWGALAADRKAAYQAQHEKAKENYQKVLEQYKKSDNYAAYQEKVAAWKKAKKTDKKKIVKRKK
jgi:hypothetical protein